MVSATQRAKSQPRRDEREGLVNAELLRSAAKRDWLSQDVTVRLITALEAKLAENNELAVTTREVKFLDRAHGLREALEIVKNQK